MKISGIGGNGVKNNLPGDPYAKDNGDTDQQSPRFPV